MSLYLTSEQKRITRDDEERRRKHTLTHYIKERIHIYIYVCWPGAKIEQKRTKEEKHIEKHTEKAHREKQHKSFATPHFPPFLNFFY
jgi:hypothetical protein